MPSPADQPHPDRGTPGAPSSPHGGRTSADEPASAREDPDEAERRRLEAVRATGLLGVAPGDRLDRIARRAARIAGAPLGLISLVDEHDQWNPGAHGEGAPRRLLRDESFCSAAISSTGPFVVPDATKDPDWSSLPAVVSDPNVRFYAGHPIDDGDGHVLGVVCVLDVVPREAGPELLQALSDLSVWARHELLRGEEGAGLVEEADAVVNAADAAGADERLRELERLQALVVSTTAHELRTPLTVLRVHAELLLAASDDLGPEERASLIAINRAVQRLEHVSEDLVTDLRDTAEGAEEALRRWLHLERGSERMRPGDGGGPEATDA